MLTQECIKKLKHLISKMTILEEKIDLLPTRAEVFSKIDQVVNEIRSMRKENQKSGRFIAAI